MRLLAFRKRLLNIIKKGKPMDFSSLTPKKQVKIQHRLKVLHDCRSSGMTNQAFCEQNGISIKSYYYWFFRLLLETCSIVFFIVLTFF